MQILDCDHNTDCRLLSLDHRTWYKIYLENELDFFYHKTLFSINIIGFAGNGRGSKRYECPELLK
jgi:hypothetical protein